MPVITLVRPPVLIAKRGYGTYTCPPIGLAYIAGSLVEKGHDVRVVEAVGEAPDQRLPTNDLRFLSRGLGLDEIIARVPAESDVIAVSAMFSHEWPLTRDLLNGLRTRFADTPIVAGGEHVTALPGFSLENCPALDVAVLGEGEETMVELVEALESGSLNFAEISGIVYRDEGTPRHSPARPRMRALDDIPPPAWGLFPLERYLERGYGFGVNRGRSMPVLATRGCPYQCTFCSSPTMWGTCWVARDVDLFFKEMMEYREKYQIDNFDFYDLTAIVKKSWILQFCDLVIDSGVSLTWQLPSGTRSEAIDGEVARRLYESGCRNMSYAPESGSVAVLERIKKKIKLPIMKQSMRDAVAVGINCKTNIIIGFPGETHKEIWETIRFCVSMALIGVHDMSIYPFSPYPGTELFDDLQKAGRILTLNDDYFFSLATYTDLTSTTSYSEYISDKVLGRYRLFGMLLYYTVLYLRYPWRLIRTLRNVFSEQQESRLELSLRDLLVRV